jgi:hypothetical protein
MDVGVACFAKLLRHLPGGNEKDHKNSGRVSGLGFEASTSLTQGQSITNLLGQCICLLVTYVLQLITPAFYFC